MTDFRALCAELADAYLRLLEHINNSTWLGYEPSDDPLLLRARAALANEPAAGEPASVTGQPSDEELLNFARNQEPWKTWLHPGGCLESAHCEVADLLSAVLARWGNPAPAPPADGEVEELIGKLVEVVPALAEMGWDQHAQRILRAAELLQRQAPVPVPVSERLPGSSDCVPHPRTKTGNWCWGFERCEVSLARPARWRLMHMETVEMEASHWLPAHALPLPGQEVEG